MLWFSSKVYISVPKMELKGEATYPLKTDPNKWWLSSLCLPTLSKQKFLSPESLCSAETFETEQSNLFLFIFCVKMAGTKCWQYMKCSSVCSAFQLCTYPLSFLSAYYHSVTSVFYAVCSASPFSFISFICCRCMNSKCMPAPISFKKKSPWDEPQLPQLGLYLCMRTALKVMAPILFYWPVQSRCWWYGSRGSFLRIAISSEEQHTGC